MDCSTAGFTVFSRQEYWSGLPFPSPGNLPGSGVKAMSPALAGWFFTTEPLRKPYANFFFFFFWKSLSHVWLLAIILPGQNTGVSSLSLLQGIVPTQGLNPDLSHCRWILYQLSHKGSPRILKWVAYPFSSRSSWPRKDSLPTEVWGKPHAARHNG